MIRDFFPLGGVCERACDNWPSLCLRGWIDRQSLSTYCNKLSLCQICVENIPKRAKSCLLTNMRHNLSGWRRKSYDFKATGYELPLPYLV